MIKVVIPYDKTCESISTQLTRQELKFDSDVIKGYEEDAAAAIHLFSRWLIDDKVRNRVVAILHKDVMKHIKSKNNIA